MVTILRPSWLAYRLTTSMRLAPRASLPLASRQAYGNYEKIQQSQIIPGTVWYLTPLDVYRHCSSDSGDQKGADKLASLLSSLKKKQPSDKESINSECKEEGVKLAQPKAKKPIKRTSGGLPKPR